MRALEGPLNFRFNVAKLSSRARINPASVTARAVSLRYEGMVIGRMDVGGIFFEIRNPAKMLPMRRRLIALRSRGLFSLIKIREGRRGWPSSAKKIIRVLYTAVREVAMRVMSRAQALA